MSQLLWIGLGGALGAMSRFWVVSFLARKLGTGFPYGTLAVNALGSFVMLFFLTLLADRLVESPHLRLLVAVGFLGSFTTFSSFSYETLFLYQEGEYMKAVANLFLNNLLALGFGVLGLFSARSLMA